jgi:DNA-binding response OmpR family regulator
MPARPLFAGPARVMVVAREPLRGVVALTLDHGVFDTRLFGTVPEARASLTDTPPHLVIVDLDLRADPLSLIGRSAGGKATVPSIALASRGHIKTKLAAFEAGVDDFVTVPVSPEELVARVLSLMRRTYGDVVRFVPKIKIRDLEIDLLNQRVRAGTSQLHLTAIEQGLLYLLASNPGRVMTRSEIRDGLWGQGYPVAPNIVDFHVRSLRVKLKNSWRHPRYIGTVPGRGYRFLVASEDAR